MSFILQCRITIILEQHVLSLYFTLSPCHVLAVFDAPCPAQALEDLRNCVSAASKQVTR
jgi:hypothetical protein